MYLYIIFFIVSLFALVELNIGKRKTKIFFYFAVLTFFLLSFLRWERGSDWDPYITSFYNINYISYYRFSFEFLFFKTNQIVNHFTKDYTYMLFVQAVMIYSCYFYIIKKYSLNPLYSCIVWLAISIGNIFFTRQAIAVSFIFLSYSFIRDRKLLLFSLTIIIAYLFHRSAIIFFPAYFLYNLNMSRSRMVLIIIIAFFTTIVATKLFAYIGTLQIENISDRSDSYLSQSDNSFGSAMSPLETMIRGLIYRLGILIFLMFYFHKEYENNKYYRGIFNISFFGTIIFIIFVPMSVTMIRFSAYYEIFQLLLYPFLLSFVKDRRLLNLTFFVLLLFFTVRFISAISSYEDLFIPYKSIFNKDLKVKVY